MTFKVEVAVVLVCVWFSAVLFAFVLFASCPRVFFWLGAWLFFFYLSGAVCQLISPSFGA
jgi:hypothetical protein